MDRSIDREEREQPNERPTRSAPAAPKDRENRTREKSRGGRRPYSVSPHERETMYDVGRFRVVNTEDLAGLKYLGKEEQMRQDIRHLVAQGLLQTKTVWTGKNRESDTFVALTRAGKSFVKRHHLV